MTDIILEAINLRKEFGGLIAVADVSLQVERGGVHAIIGPNGAGKTTLFNLLSGRYKATNGRVMLNGKDVTNVALHRRVHLGMGRSFQITNIFPNLTVLENVRLASQALSNKKLTFFRNKSIYKDFTERAMHLLTLVGLEDMALLPANTLPHGGKRKLELAILLAPSPELLLLDEPTAGMASEQVPQLMDIINRIRLSEGDTPKTVVLVEHNMNVVMNISDRITVMNYGAVLAEGTPTEISQNETVQNVYLGGLYSSLTELGE